MILILRQFLVDCRPATGEVRAMGFVSVTFGFGYGMQAPPEPLRRTRGPSLPVLWHFACQPFAPQLTGPFPTACALLRKPRRSAKFRPHGLFAEEVRDVVSTLRNFSRAAYRSPSASRGRRAFFRNVSITHIPDGLIASRPARMHLKPNSGVRGSWQRAVGKGRRWRTGAGCGACCAR